MRQREWCGRLVARAWMLTGVLALSGCEGPPSVSSTHAEASVHGTVKYNGAPVTGGDITFDPANIQRRDAKAATGAIGKDGTYKVTTLQGANVIRLSLPPELLAKDAALATYNKQYDVPSGDSTCDIDLSAAP